MAKLAFIAVTKNMEKAAERYLEKHPSGDVILRYFPASESEQALAFLTECGAQFVITRGTMAKELRRMTNLSVIEVVITAQEMGLLIKTAKRLVARKRPRIAVIGSKNMFCDMQDFNDIFDIDLRFYAVEATEELATRVVLAKEDHTDLVIGGEIVCEQAANLGMLYLRQPDGRDSIAQAFQTASRVIWAAENESKNTRELKALLDYTSFGIMKVGVGGEIEMLNNRAASYLEPLCAAPLGANVYDVFSSHCSQTAIQDLLDHGESSFFTAWISPDLSLAVSVDPMTVGGKLAGSFWAVHEVDELKQLESQARTSLFQSSHLATTRQWLSGVLSENRPILSTAAKYAQYGENILLSGGHQMERELIARYIHDSSLYASSAFVYLYAEEFLTAPELSRSGDLPCTIFIDHVEELSAPAQARLQHLLLQLTLPGGISQGDTTRLFLFGTSQPLDDLVREGTFSPGLYHLISPLQLQMPLLQNCPNEIYNWLLFYITQFTSPSTEQFYATKAAKAAITAYPWPGGLAELRHFCRRVAVSVPNCYLDEPTALHLLNENRTYTRTPDQLPLRPADERERLQQLMEKYGGNRAQIASELHISLTTLWRRMKKYGLIES